MGPGAGRSRGVDAGTCSRGRCGAAGRSGGGVGGFASPGLWAMGTEGADRAQIGEPGRWDGRLGFKWSFFLELSDRGGDPVLFSSMNANEITYKRGREEITILSVGRKTAVVRVRTDGYPDRETRVLRYTIPAEALAAAIAREES